MNNTAPQQNPVALVTGASRRIGAAIANRFHEAGYKLIVHYNHSAADADRLCEQLNQIRPNSCLLTQANLSNDKDLQKISSLVSSIGRLDVLVNNASSFYPTPLDKLTEAQWDNLTGSNLKGPFFLAKILADFLQESRGSIINIADADARQTLKNYPAYSIAKAGNIAMTKALALELAPNVRVNSVAPGAILWPEHDVEYELEKKKSIIQENPLNRLGTVTEIAETVFFLATKATYMTGQTIAVDGGGSTTL